MKIQRCSFLILTASIASIAASCSSHPSEEHGNNPYPGGHSSQFPTCDAIIKQCHPLDVGEGPIHDCHDLGHGAEKDEDCIPKKDECLTKICIAGSDAGAADAKTD